MSTVSQEELSEISQILKQILDNDNETRKAAEAKLSQAKLNDVDKYCILLCNIIHPSTQFELQEK